MNYLIYSYILLSLYTVRKRLEKTKQLMKIFLIPIELFYLFLYKIKKEKYSATSH